MTSQRTFLLGLLFIGALGILGYYTLFLTDFTLFGERYPIAVRFGEAGGIRRGYTVLVAGVRWGRVDTVTYDPQAAERERVTVTASLDQPLVLREGFRISIEDATVLGGHNLSIEPGRYDGDPIPPGTRLYGTLAPNALDSLSELVGDNREAVTATLEDLREVTRMLREGRGPLGRAFSDEELADELSLLLRSSARTASNLETISGDLVRGEGFVGRLLTDDALYRELDVALGKLALTLDEATLVARDVREGEGLVGRLISDPTLGDDVALTLADVREVVARVEEAKGTLGLLISDDAIATDVRAITAAVATGKGSLGRAVTQPELYDNLNLLAANLQEVSQTLREGQGTVGRLVMDDELYEELRKAMGIVTRTLEEFREAAPVTTFTSVLFGAF
jgi:phospholipid/cholesterol/gamma-HCH transport system substrate-binding protein